MIEKRNAALQLKSRLETLDYVRTQFAGKEGLVLEAILVGVNRPAPGARMSAAAEQDQLRAFYIPGFTSDVVRADHWNVFVSGTMDRDIARALWAKNREQPIQADVAKEAGEIADIIAKWQEIVRQDANKAGAWIKKMPGY